MPLRRLPVPTRVIDGVRFKYVPTYPATMKVRVSRRELADMFSAGAERKMAEREAFVMRALESPEDSAELLDIAEFLVTDARFYRMAAAYYSGDVSSLEDGADEDLLLLASQRDISPRLYARYLREIGDSARQEKETHALLKDLKKAIAEEVGRRRSRQAVDRRAHLPEVHEDCLRRIGESGFSKGVSLGRLPAPWVQLIRLAALSSAAILSTARVTSSGTFAPVQTILPDPKRRTTTLGSSSL